MIHLNVAQRQNWSAKAGIIAHLGYTIIGYRMRSRFGVMTDEQPKFVPSIIPEKWKDGQRSAWVHTYTHIGTNVPGHVHLVRAASVVCVDTYRMDFPSEAQSICRHKHWVPVTPCWHTLQSLLLVCISFFLVQSKAPAPNPHTYTQEPISTRIKRSTIWCGKGL